jgi:hypothetical protein
MTNATKLLFAVPAAACAFAAWQPAAAADALLLCGSGQPYVYPGGGTNIAFNPDLGLLGPLSNAEGVAAVENAFDAWEDLTQSTMTALNAGTLPGDIDITNFAAALTPAAPDGLSPIVFDANGEIFELLFGVDSGVLGFAGPDFGDPVTCTLLEGSAFLNGPEFQDSVVAEDIMVHEFGHYINLGHAELNGQLFDFFEGGDETGPTPDNTLFPPPASLAGFIETMYPFYFGPEAGTRTPHADDISSLANLYPAPNFAATTGTITGTIYTGTAGDVPVSGVNVIARNFADPFADAVSTFSGAYTPGTDPASDPNVGRFVLSGLKPGAQYAVFVDQVSAAAGRFSNPILASLPGPEEFYNGSGEGVDSETDDPQAYELIAAAAGSPATGIDILFNLPQPGEPLAVGDDGAVEIFLPFKFAMCGTRYQSVFINANGNLTFGQPDPTYIESAIGMLDGPPRVAPLWRDINPTSGGSVYFRQSRHHFSVIYDEVPSYFAGGPNTFSVTLYKGSNRVRFRYRDIDPLDYDFGVTQTFTTPGLAGVSCGLAATSGQEPSTNLTRYGHKINMHWKTAVYEVFEEEYVEAIPAYVSTVDLEGETLWFTRTGNFEDAWAGRNNVIERARKISLPFSSLPLWRYTEIEPAGKDVDYYRFWAKAGDVLMAEVARGQIDSLMCVFDRHGTMIAQNDDSNGLLSALTVDLPANGRYSLAITTWPDFECDGGGTEELPFGEGRYILDLSLLR